MKIGIGITTTTNRINIFSRSIVNISSFTPGAKIIVITDVSGIAKANNECLKKLDDCDHIFLFDDDCYPISPDWYKPYIESKEPHLCYTWRRIALRKEGNIIYYELPDGQMLYIDRKCLDVVGGFDEAYGLYSFEHVDFSNRVFGAGLTSSRFMDVEESAKLLYAMDQFENIQSSILPLDRAKSISANRKLIDLNWNSKEWKPYK